jgi:glutamate/tyrosine decarboxylase-like PLP-dependent enzyme
MHWERKSPDEIQAAVFNALSRNLRYRSEPVLGLPGSYLDKEVFPPLPELEERPLLSCFMDNPNHIGCHTLGSSEPAFSGTQELETELVRLCAEEILAAPAGACDGYVTSGGTESNIQALWTFRNHYRDRHGASTESIGLLCSEDTHYSVYKAGDLLGLKVWSVPVDDNTREMSRAMVAEVVARAAAAGVRFFLVILNMGTTMFGSVDDPDVMLSVLTDGGHEYKAHVDAAFGGFIYPFIAKDNRLSFADPRLTSFTLDAHKMLQAPYGTGIHLIRKDHIERVLCASASYVAGLDCTLVGSRSGTNAVAVWMILYSYGSEGGKAFCRDLIRRAERLAASLRAAGVRFFREPSMNLIAMRAADVPARLRERYMLVPDRHEGRAEWLKIVIMDHVTDDILDRFLADLVEFRHELT